MRDVKVVKKPVKDWAQAIDEVEGEAEIEIALCSNRELAGCSYASWNKAMITKIG